MRRRLQEEAASKRLAAADPTLTRAERMEIIESTLETGPDDVDPLNDEAVTLALEKGIASIDGKVKEARSRSIADQISAMSKEDHHAVVEALKKVLGERQMGSADLEVRDLLFQSS